MRCCILALLAIVAFSNACSNESWQVYKMKYGKNYPTPEEELTRRQTFCDNLKEMIEHNDRFERGEEAYEMIVNQFNDWTHEEFANWLHGIVELIRPGTIGLPKPESIEVPETSDAESSDAESSEGESTKGESSDAESSKASDAEHSDAAPLEAAPLEVVPLGPEPSDKLPQGVEIDVPQPPIVELIQPEPEPTKFTLPKRPGYFYAQLENPTLLDVEIDKLISGLKRPHQQLPIPPAFEKPAGQPPKPANLYGQPYLNQFPQK